MKLLTHNILQCIVPGCQKASFVFKLTAAKVSIEEKEYDRNFVIRMIPRLDYDILQGAYNSLPLKDIKKLPVECPKDFGNNEEFLKTIFFAISNVIVETGTLTCPHCAKVYPIINSIPNMIVRDLGEEEVPANPENSKEGKKESGGTNSEGDDDDDDDDDDN